MKIYSRKKDEQKMTYEEKVRWMQRYQESLRFEKELTEEIYQLRTRAYYTSKSLIDIPKSTSTTILPSIVEEIAKYQQALQEQIRQCNAIRLEIISAIQQLSNIQEQEVLRRRYILGQKCHEISESMHFSEKWISIIHQRAINSIIENRSS